MDRSGDELTIRMLPAAEWERLREIVPHERIPHPLVAGCCVAERNGEIVGYLFAQMVMHTEPVWVRREHRGQDLPGRMWEELSAHLPPGAPVYAFSKSELVDSILGERCGFDRLPWAVFTREVERCPR